MPKNHEKATVPTTDVPKHNTIAERFALLTKEEKQMVIRFCEQLKSDRYSH